MAYTKYSLTPANNTATPPDGAPEGMLPSAVNDTMRDMMAQIRDCGDGIRDGTYTMTAPKITGGTITGSTINNSAIGGTTANSGAFTTLSASGVATISAGTVSAPALTTTGDTNTGIFFPAADTIAFTEGGAEAMRIDSSGNVGIGTSSPSTQLQMNSSAATYSDQLRIRNTNFGNADIGVGSGIMAIATDMANITFYTSSNLGTTGSSVPSNERMRIDSSGNVGIGTSSPRTVSGYTTVGVNGSTGGIVDLFSNTTRVATFSADSTVANVTAVTSIPLVFNTNNTERMRIDSSGNLLVGTTSSSRTSGAGVKVIPGATPTNYIVGASSVNNDSALDVYSTGAGAYRFQIGYGGTIYATSTTITGISDQRLKENIIDLDEGLNAVMALKPRKFDWKTGKGKDIKGDRGFIAQEFEQVFPDMIEESKDHVPEGEEPYKAVNANIIPTLVKAIQEQQAMIEELKQEVAALKAK